jgi:hypothetical protein
MMSDRVKKVLKIAGIAAGSLILIAVIGVVFVSGLPLFGRVTETSTAPPLEFELADFPSIDFALTDFPHYGVEFSAETHIARNGDVVADVPAHFFRVRESSNFNIYADSYNEEHPRWNESVTITPPSDSDFDLAKLADTNNAQAAADFFRSLGLEPPQTLFDFFYTTFAVTSDNYSGHRAANAEAFWALATLKETAVESMVTPCDEFYYYQNEHFRGFILVRRHESRNHPDIRTDSFIADLHLRDGSGRSVLVLVDMNDDDTAWAIINSVRIQES